MTAIEITLLVLGAIIFAASFVVPELKKEPSKEQQRISEAEIRKVIENEMEHVRERIDGVVEETIDYTMEKTERSLAKISNEKIMAVNEYSDTVLEEINKNHKEVMFLYDMLNDKQTDLKNTVRKVEATKEEAVAAVEEATTASTLARQEWAYPEPVQQEPVVSEFEPMMPERVEMILEAPEVIPEERMPKPIFNRFMEGAESEKILSVNETVHVKKIVKPEASKQAATVKKASANQQEPTVIRQQKSASSGRTGNSKNNNQRILELHREGKSNIDIAKELGLGLGEVKLVLDLFEGV